MQKNKIDRDIVIILVMTLITVVSWAGFEICLSQYKDYDYANLGRTVTRSKSGTGPRDIR